MMDVGVESAICIWDYDHLPDPLKEYMEENAIPNDDIDWIALRPKIYDGMWINWLEEPAFGCCSVKEYAVGTIGYTLIVGYHS